MECSTWQKVLINGWMDEMFKIFTRPILLNIVELNVQFYRKHNLDVLKNEDNIFLSYQNGNLL